MKTTRTGYLLNFALLGAFFVTAASARAASSGEDADLSASRNAVNQLFTDRAPAAQSDETKGDPTEIAAAPKPSPSPSQTPASALPLAEKSPEPSRETVAEKPQPAPSAFPAVEVAKPEPSAAPLALAPQPEPTVKPSPSPSPTIANSSRPEIDVDHVEDNVIFFRADSGKPPKPLKTSLSEVTYLGAIHSENHVPYFIFAARPCRNCTDEREIVFLRSDTPYDTRFEYPGKIIDQKSGAAVLNSRAFYGKCLSRSGEAYVVFQQERVDKRHRSVSQSSVLIAEADEDHLDERLIERHLPRLDESVKLVKRKLCKEISGLDRKMARRPPDLNFRHRDDTEDTDAADSDDDDVKPNQTDKDLQPAAAAATSVE